MSLGLLIPILGVFLGSGLVVMVLEGLLRCQGALILEGGTGHLSLREVLGKEMDRLLARTC